MAILDETTGRPAEPDWGCYEAASGSAAQDADAGAMGPDAVASVLVQVSYAPGNNVGFAGATVDQFLEASALGQPTHSGLSDAAGQVMFTVPSHTQRISLWVHGTSNTGSAVTDIVDALVLDVPVVWPPNPIIAPALVALAVDTTIVNVLGSLEQGDRTKATLSATVRDCNGIDVSGAQLELIDAATGAPVKSGTGAGEPFGVYGRFALPDKTCTFTSWQRSEWLMLNAPVNVGNGAVTSEYKIRATGRMRESEAAPALLDERPVELHAGAWVSASPYKVYPAAAR